jgi:MHS family shikimate/dehydroshikimate transporter-like MFS transporter
MEQTMRQEDKKIFKITTASGFGTFFEWYDFLLYATATALVFNKLFFPASDPAVGILLSIAIFAVGYIARPLGGIIFGHFGDRFGRKSMLMLTTILMGISTFAIGLLPTYESIGLWAPACLIVLRILQGLSFGGEWAGGSLMILEHAPANRRGFFASFVQIGYPIGSLAAVASFWLVNRFFEADFLTWGWRIPFLFSIILIAFGIFIRSRLPETPIFEKIKENKKVVKFPIVDVIKNEWRSLLLGIGIKTPEIAVGYLSSVFFPLWAVNNLGLKRGDIMDVVLLALSFSIIAIPLSAYISDIIGRRKIYIFGYVSLALLSYPMWSSLASGNLFWPIMFGIIVGSIMLAPLASFLPELFKSETRYTGAGVTNQVAAALGGGVVPLLATSIAVKTGSLIGIAYLMIVLSIISLICTLITKETYRKDLTN